MSKINLTSKFRALLRSRAQTIDPVVMVGHAGITDNVVKALIDALDSHEIVKVKFQDFKKETKALSLELEEKSGSVLVAVTGFTAVYYNPNFEKKN